MAAEIIVDITKAFPGRTPICARFRHAIDAATVLILFGPSGSGKTTILRSLAGLEWPEEGSIRYISKAWLDTAARIRVAPQDRHIGYMSQDYALFPTYTVTGNIAYGLGALSAADRKKRVDEMLDLFQLRNVEHAKPRELSGGQQQRVALARAVAPRPLLLLLDEPLSALDAPTRNKLCGELRLLLTRLAIPSVVVTHDWAEALALGDHMVVIDDGRVLQTGKPQEVFSRPANAEVARVVGVETVVQGRVAEVAEGLATVQVGEVTLTAVASNGVGHEVFVCIRAEDVTLEPASAGATSARNHLAATVRSITSIGALAKVTVDCGFPLTALVTRPALADLRLEADSPVRAAVKAGSVHLVPRVS